MKLTKELKKRIDDYFDNISSNEFVDMLVAEFNFPEIINVEVENKNLFEIQVSDYLSQDISVVEFKDEKDFCTFSKAA